MSLLSVDNVTMRFGGLTAVNQVSINVEPGKIFSVIGPNGAGKTTLFNAITGIYHPTEGRVCSMGNNSIRPLTWKSLLAFILVGVLTAVLGFVATVDIDRLWLSAIKRQMVDVFAEEERLPAADKGTAEFFWDDAIEDGIAFINSEPAVERRAGLRGDTWRVVSAEGESLSKPYRNSGVAWRVRDSMQDNELKTIKTASGYGSKHRKKTWLSRVTNSSIKIGRPPSTRCTIPSLESD